MTRIDEITSYGEVGFGLSIHRYKSWRSSVIWARIEISWMLRCLNERLSELLQPTKFGVQIPTPSMADQAICVHRYESWRSWLIRRLKNPSFFDN